MLKENTRNLTELSPRYKEINELLASQELVKKNKALYEKLRGGEKEWQIPVRTADDKPTGTLTEEDKKKISFYDDLNNYFKGNIPADLKEKWENLNKRPDITQEQYNILVQQASKPGVDGLPSTWKEDLAELKDLKDKLDKASKGEIKDPAILSLLASLLTDENKNLWNHVNDLAKIMEEIVPKAPKPPK